MANIKLFSLADGVKELTSNAVTLERELQNVIEQNMLTFFGVTFLKSEFIISQGRIDSLGLDENNCPVIFEYKRSINENVINQGLFYLDWLLDHKADFKLLVMDVLGTDTADSIDWSSPCVICIANDFTKFDEHAVNQMHKNIRLVKYKKFSEDLILLEYLNTPVTITNSVNSPKQHKALRNDFSHNFERSPSRLQNIYLSIRDYILSLGDDVVENQLKLYVAFRRTRNIVCVEIYPKKIVMQMRVDPKSIEVVDGFTQDTSGLGHYGTGNLRVIVRSAEDFERSKQLIDRAYNEN